MSSMPDTDHSLAYLADAEPAEPRRLLVLAHGVGGNETNLAPLAARVPSDTVVVLARGPLTLGPGQYAWFRVAFGPHGPRPDLAAAEAGCELSEGYSAKAEARLKAAGA